VRCVHQPVPNVMRWELFGWHHLPEPHDLARTIEQAQIGPLGDNLREPSRVRHLSDTCVEVTHRLRAREALNGHSLNEINDSFKKLMSVRWGSGKVAYVCIHVIPHKATDTKAANSSAPYVGPS
jgi:hypothetical protein